jgi:tRNA A58 N-methylase Trm61
LKELPGESTVLEIGVLKGTGLFLWALAKPDGRIVGLDHNLANVQSNWENLKRNAGTIVNTPEIYEFDCYFPNESKLGDFFLPNEIRLVIDDGPHTVEAVCTVARALLPFLAEDCWYLIEDTPQAFEAFKNCIPVKNAKLHTSGLITAQIDVP